MADRTDIAADPAKDKASKYWLDCISDAQRYFSYWQEKCDNIDKLYAELKKLSGNNLDREFQMFWANIEILRPSVYSRAPVPVVVPRWKDQQELPRKASEVLERSLLVNFEETEIHGVMLQVRDDLLMAGRGAAWIRLEDRGEQGERNVVEHLDRTDFLHEPARKWEEVGWCSRRAWLTREKVRGRFGDEIAGELGYKQPADKDSGEKHTPEYKGEEKAEVWEIWSRTRRQVVWVSPGYPEVLDMQDPFLNLEGFFPCPKPAYSTVERRKLLPVPDFYFVRDQLEEINEMTARISALAEGLRLKGIVPGGAGDLAEAVETALKRTDNNAVVIPVANFQALGAASLKDSIVWLPLVEVANTIKELVFLRRQFIEDVYQISGVSDIMRGSTDPDETLGAQELKSQYGSIRIRERQAELVRFARDVTRISAEVMAENYSPEQFLAVTQLPLPTSAQIEQQANTLIEKAQQFLASEQGQAMLAEQPQQVEELKEKAEAQLSQLQATVTIDQVATLLREQRTRPFVLEIETDSTIQADENAEKTQRNEFLGVFSTAMTQLAPLVTQNPSAAPMAVEILKFALAPYRAGRSVEAAIEQFADSVKQDAQQRTQNPTPSPDQVKAQSDQQRLAFEEKKHADEMALRTKEMDQANEREVRKARLEGDLAGAAAGQPAAYSMSEVIAQLAQQNAQVLQALTMIAQVLAAPKTVTTPEGRTYTTQPSPPQQQGMN